MSSFPSSSSPRTLKIGIIGFGPFAQFLAKTIIKQGHTIRATSRSDHSELSVQLGISFFRNMDAFLESDNDVILLSTSILSLSEVVKSMPFNRLKGQTLFADVLSVKEYPREVLLQTVPQDCDVLCTHPMFGPESGKEGWKDLTFVYDRVRISNEAICRSFLQIFQTEFLAKTIIKQGHTIRATSRSDHSELSVQLGISFFRNMDAFLESDNDVILLSTSILSLSEVVKSMPFNRLKGQTLFADVLSVKEYPREVLLQTVPQDCDVLCTHPMFGPESGKEGWKDLTFVYDRVRISNEAICRSFLQIFQTEAQTWAKLTLMPPEELQFIEINPTEGCKMLEISCEEHDKLAAQSQFLTHTIGWMLSEMEIGPTSIDTKGFQKLVQVKQSTTKDSFDLFCGLFIHNRFARQEVQNLELALEKVKQKLKERMNEDQDRSVSNQ
ncbi:unnamed protein product [Ilex paraguariensis]|uniref:Prephenate/arogenate dehydrogenase domain-containing protein n=1 Tax=Ilex paraguariensis TaxID=185542 RepID=A0ABC8TVH7_9AQUA